MKHKILMVIDTQKDFITGALGNKECEAAVPKIIDIIKHGNYDQMILTMDTHKENYLETKEGQNLPVPHCIRETHGWQINTQIMTAVTENYTPQQIQIIEKPTFGAIDLVTTYQKLWNTYGTQLEIDFVGFCTGICVLSNVTIAKASIPEAEICVIEDACACVTPETHKTAIAAMKLIQVKMLKTTDL